MTNRTLSSILVLILGLLIVLVPIYLLPVCPPIAVDDGHGHISYKFMKCFWTARAELGLGFVVIACGFVMLIAKQALVRLGVSLALFFIAILVTAIPTVLIGMCPNPIMPCNVGTLPALLLLSGSLLLVAVVNAFYLHKKSS